MDGTPLTITPTVGTIIGLLVAALVQSVRLYLTARKEEMQRIIQDRDDRAKEQAATIERLERIVWKLTGVTEGTVNTLAQQTKRLRGDAE